jgi:putative ABC transport system substrate-binding protein
VLSVDEKDNADTKARHAAFRDMLRERGWEEGRNLRIDYRWSAGDKDLMQRYAVELVGLGAVSNNSAIELISAPAQNLAEVETTIAAIASEPGGGLITGADAFIVAHRVAVIRLSDRYRVPAIYANRQYAMDGGLMSYGPDTADVFRRSANYVDRILKGEKPADLTVQKPAKFEFVINLKTAKALGLTVSPSLLARADEVIE